MLARFTQIDYDREIALVALDDDPKAEERMLGAARIIGDPDAKEGEFAVVVGDPYCEESSPWKHGHCISISGRSFRPTNP